ncbi:MAG TPA: membrane protein insertase YidC [Chryseosolibacter sp.]
MDRNSAIGLTLIAALLMVYFYWFAPEPAPAPKTAPSQSAQPQQSEAGKQVVTPSDSVLAQTYGDLSSFAQGNEEAKVVENEDIRATFSNKGGYIKSLELKKYKTYTQKPLFLITPERSTFELLTKYQGKDIDLYDLFYQVNETKRGDTTVIDYSVKLANGAFLTHSYAIPPSGYQIAYSIKQKGLAEELGGETLTFRWNDLVQPLEKDLQDTRNNTTVNYFTVNEGFEDLDERSTSDSEIIQQPLKWVSIKQKFFLSSIIAKNNFSGAELATATPEGDSSIVEQQSLKLFIPKSQLIEAKTDFKFYVGPNDYQEIDIVADKFEKNVYLGWPPVYWINKFVIFPVFHFLTKYIGNYGLIIIILVILLKLVLAPLSYKSYLSMAKMKVLKPDLDVIKEKHGDDMAKVQQEQLKLYQQVGVNPISGCIPVLLQMPILFAMFYLFPASIELRQQPFLWAEDLSTYDSIIRLPFVIPFGVGDHISLFTLLMTVSTLIYTWQNNQLSSVQGPMKSMSYIMPVIFFFVLNSFSAGLTFYYFVSNLVTFAQQAIIRRFVDDDKIKVLLEENRKKNAAGGGGKKSKFMARLEDAMKASEEARKKAEEDRKKKKS